MLVRFRKKRNPVADHAGVTSHTSTWLEVAVAVAEAVLLVGLSMPLWADRVEHLPPPGESTRVRVVAEQFAWNVHYPGPDGVFGRTDVKLIDLQSNPLGLDREDPAAKDDVTTINQLHLPVDRPALLTLTSKDVIHSFALQEMRIKQDVVPGVAIQVWFVPKVTTDEMRSRNGNPEFNYEISCAQLCGLGHYRMRGYVTIESPEGFQKWMDDQAGPARARRGPRTRSGSSRPRAASRAGVSTNVLGGRAARPGSAADPRHGQELEGEDAERREEHRARHRRLLPRRQVDVEPLGQPPAVAALAGGAVPDREGDRDVLSLGEGHAARRAQVAHEDRRPLAVRPGAAPLHLARPRPR